MADAIWGTIIEAMRGTGRVRLDDGRELPFESTASTHPLAAGTRARVTLETTRLLRRHRVARIEPLRTIATAPPAPTFAFSSARRILDEARLAPELDLARARALLALEPDPDPLLDPPTIGTLLARHVTTPLSAHDDPAARRRRDGLSVLTDDDDAPLATLWRDLELLRADRDPPERETPAPGDPFDPAARLNALLDANDDPRRVRRLVTLDGAAWVLADAAREAVLRRLRLLA